MADNVIIKTNRFQTPVTREFLASMPSEVQEQFMDFVDNVPLVKYMIGDERKRAIELPRDKWGRIIVDIAHPHILENMDYFRPAAKFFEENGCYTFLKPNPNPKSEYGKWYTEELRRCLDGYVRESDGEWITGYMYFYLNYSPIMLNRKSEVTGRSIRTESLPDFWEGIYYRFHYLEQARSFGKHCMELARRGCSKSYSLASMMAHNLVLGESGEERRRRTTVLTAYLKEYLADKDGTFTKFTPIIDHLAKYTEFPRLMLTRRANDMIWRMGYKDSNGNERGSLNSVMGLSVKDDEGKIRGKRGVILFEEFGSYPNIKEVYNNTQESVTEGDDVFSLIYGVGTSGDEESDFAGVRTMLYNPEAFNLYAIDNVYDLVGKGSKKFVYFFPSYISRAGCMDVDGNSDVTKALYQILMQRYTVKQSNDSKSLLSKIAQMPITPAEAILKVKSNFFPVVLLNERLRQIDENPRIFDDVYVGTLVNINGTIEFRSTDDVPIRDYPVDNTFQGAIEIFEMPPKKNIPPQRYIVGHDPVDNDQAESSSLSSTFVFDLFTDRIVAEYTGRKPFAEDNYEIVLNLCKFYNATCLYESNKKGLYAYFSRMREVWRLADCPEYLRDRQLVKYSPFGSSAKGVSVSAAINGYANDLIRDWLLKTYTAEIPKENGEKEIVQVPNLFAVRNKALIKELIAYNPEINVDRVRALAMVMLYREQFIILYGGSPESQSNKIKDVADDEFFNLDWNRYVNSKIDKYRALNQIITGFNTSD